MLCVRTFAAAFDAFVALAFNCSGVRRVPCFPAFGDRKAARCLAAT